VPAWVEVEVLLQQLAQLGRPARVLAVLDASASMRGVTATGATRAEVTQDAVTGVLAQFPDTSSVGLWFFASGLGSDGAGGRTDHVEVVPLRPLDPAAAGTDQRAELAAGTRELSTRLTAGGTGLFDTALAAVRAVREGYDPGAVNSVVLVTDGRQDDPGAPALAELVATLQAEADPERPVRVVTVGIGSGVDAAELRAIAEATGGAAYLAEQPGDLQAVLADALRRR
jgi:Mg-chelatase subunit ChlD